MPKGYSQWNQSGWKHTDKTRAKVSRTRKLFGVAKGEKNPRWKGDKVSYGALHTWINNTLGAPDTCECCLRSGLKGGKIHWANVSREYKRDPRDWRRLCAKCHKMFDKNNKQKVYAKRIKI